MFNDIYGINKREKIYIIISLNKVQKIIIQQLKKQRQKPILKIYQKIIIISIKI